MKKLQNWKTRSTNLKFEKIKIMNNLIERLKICWNVLTKRNYVYFGIGKNPFVWDENGDYVGIKDGKFAEYEYIENVKFNTDNGLSSLKKIMWSSIEEYAKNSYSIEQKKLMKNKTN